MLLLYRKGGYDLRRSGLNDNLDRSFTRRPNGPSHRYDERTRVTWNGRPSSYPCIINEANKLVPLHIEYTVDALGRVGGQVLHHVQDSVALDRPLTICYAAW